MRVAVNDGVELAVVTDGPVGAPLVVFAHGFSGAKEDWVDHFEALSSRFRVVAFDHRGHGASGRPADEAAYSLDRMAHDVTAVAGSFGVERFVLVGTSMGGMAAQRLALANPECLDGLVLQCTWPGPPPGIRLADVQRAATIARERGIEELHRISQGADDPLTTPAHERLLRERPGYQEFCDRKFLDQSPHMYAAIVVELVAQPDLAERLGAISSPTLVVAGEQDTASRVGCERIAQAIPGAELVVVPDAGHSPQLENPRAWLEAVTPFLERVAN